ncbi:uncharacterized protein FIESC28_11542 [Fusarium coffeatum]|uniref:N-acetyltransferase domain-containing protein n=1 Tax=Fusarium coffeatum TaxID=231269 RepID=A0A366QI02_9HYPO|nr:uncharacterized protein FIESC28_11542 [Fusarium coffeatum]RBR04559.1 hypothetical protein FIESC28_11542 [Fusarium coffeatum]
MAERQLHRLGFVQIRTTLAQLPYPRLEDRPTITTERLVLKPFYEGAAEDLHPMRVQQEVMKWTSQGAPDKSIEETRKWTLTRLPPNHEIDFSYVISLLETGEVIGAGGSFRRECELGWPGIGYAFRKEAWGKGYATEFVKAYMEAWWKLPRVEVLMEVDHTTLSEEEIAASPEALIEERCSAEALSNNPGSHRVLEKAGFVKVKEWRNEEKNWLIYGWVTPADARTRGKSA